MLSSNLQNEPFLSEENKQNDELVHRYSKKKWIKDRELEELVTKFQTKIKDRMIQNVDKICRKLKNR